MLLHSFGLLVIYVLHNPVVERESDGVGGLCGCKHILRWLCIVWIYKCETWSLAALVFLLCAFLI